MDYSLDRRAALALILGGTATACKAKTPVELDSKRDALSGMFSHGVASGDPLTDRVIIWTRVDIRQAPGPRTAPDISLVWEVSESESFESLTTSGTHIADSTKDHTAKIDVTGLKPGTWYYFRFKSGDVYSPAGRTRTLPEGKVDKARFAVVSCANWQQGFFNVYDHIARDGGFDALLHLGDYFYEYHDEKATEPMRAAGRLHEPPHEIVTLEDYRTRHAQYRSDPALQSITAQMPMIAVWDDHESSNDSWKDGAENHQAKEGDWAVRKQMAMRAYYEWMPVRDPKPGTGRDFLFRGFEWGDLLSICAVETRLLARSEPIIVEDHYELMQTEGGLEKFKTEILGDPSREMFGQIQLEWIVDQFAKSKSAGKPWRLLANQVLLGRLITPDLTPHVDEASIEAIEKEWAGIRDFVGLSAFGMPVYPDSWDGYPAARDRFYDALKKAGVEDMLVVTGDSHEFWANDLTASDGGKVGLELGTTSVSSDTLASFLGGATEDYALLMTQSNADARYYNPLTSGYIDLTLTPKKGVAKLVGVDTTDSQQYTAFEAAKFNIVPDGKSLKFSSPSGLNVKQRALFHGLG